MQERDSYFCEIKVDPPPMQQKRKLVERVGEEKELGGRDYVYNHFPLRNAENRDAITTFGNFVSVGEIPVLDDYPLLDELKKHPWIAKCWIINSNAIRKHLRERKIEGTELLVNAKVLNFGKLHSSKLVFPYPATFEKRSRSIA